MTYWEESTYWGSGDKFHYMYDTDSGEKHVAIIDPVQCRYWHNKMPNAWHKLPDSVHDIMEARAWVLSSWSTS